MEVPIRTKGSLTCDLGFKMTNCVFHSYVKEQPSGVQTDGTVIDCTLTYCTTYYCVLRAICMLDMLEIGNYSSFFLITFGKVSKIQRAIQIL